MLSIEPYSSVGEVLFGMTEKQVEKIVGLPEYRDTSDTMTSEMRKGINYQYDSGKKLACITFDSRAIVRNSIELCGKPLSLGLMENLKILNSLTEEVIKKQHPFMYIYPELGLVLYMRKTYDFILGTPQRIGSYMIAACNKSIIEKFQNISHSKEEAVYSQIMNAIDNWVQE